MNGKLILQRRKNINGMAIAMDIFINDRLVGKINNGEQKEFELEPGVYKLKVQQNIKSGEQEFTVQENQTVNFSFTPTPFGFISVLSPLIGLGLLFLFKISISLTALILLPGAITSVYLLTGGRAKYFLFRKEN